MSHENSVTVEMDGKHYIISGVDNRILGGPFATKADAEYRAKVRSMMQGALGYDRPEDDTKLGLGDLGELMREGYKRIGR